MTRVDDFDALLARKEQGADRVVTVIETALHNVKQASADDGYSGQALRLRGAAVLLQTAAIEVASHAGMYEIAAEVSASGMLDGETSGDG